ncbi:MAG: (4Fe-4S)-binding protein [Sphingobacteriales bacterium]
MHSGKCVRGLPLVFDPRRKPWIDAQAATTLEIVEQVKVCPSGALSYVMNHESA